MARWVCLQPIALDDALHMPGAEITLSEQQARQLLDLGHIEPAVEQVQAQPEAEPTKRRSRRAKDADR